MGNLKNYWIVLEIIGWAALGATLARENIALQKTVYQSSTLRDWNGSAFIDWSANLAIDNVTQITASKCRCCAGTYSAYPDNEPWWEIDLGSVVRVGMVKIFGDQAEPSRFKLFVSETTPYNYSTSSYVYINDVTPKEHQDKHAITEVILGETPLRYIALVRDKPDKPDHYVLLVVCEAQVFKACNNYHFEPDCSQCHCDGAPCNKASGICPGGCTQGWKGHKCDQECTAGTYGPDCKHNCGKCRSDDPCDISTGHCPGGCMPGYSGDTCEDACSSSSYGENCSHACGHCYGDGACNHVTGICHSCAAGYHGDMCMAECTPGKYGPDCQHDCGNCGSDDPCDISSGHCHCGCMPGYRGDKCEDECTAGTYGPDCKHNCGKCRSDDPCDISTGHCPSGCMPGYSGDTCEDEICEANTYSVDCVPCGHCLQGDACDVVTGYCPRGCETTHIGDHCVVPKAHVHLESVLIGFGICVGLIALIALIVIGIKHTLRTRQLTSNEPTVTAVCQEQSVCEEQRHSLIFDDQSMYVEIRHVSECPDNGNTVSQ